MNRRAGVLMIEVLLAILLLSAGVLSFYALLNSGLLAASRTQDLTRAAAFADSVFAGLRAESHEAARTGAFHAFWTGFITGSNRLPVEVADAWQGAALAVRVGGPHTNEYRNYPLHGPTNTSYLSHVLRYTIDAGFVAGPVGPATNHVAVTLRVWRGRIVPETRRNAYVFHGEFAEGSL